MAQNYDNWERLVGAVLRRERDKEIALRHSRDASSTSDVSFSDEQSVVELPMDYSDLTLHHSEWKEMLPPHKQIVVWTSAYMSFFLDPGTGKNCFMLGVPNLVMSEIFASEYHSESRFLAVAVPRYSVGKKTTISIEGRIKTQMLSPETLYASYLVFRLRNKDLYHELDLARSTSTVVRFMHDAESKYDYSERQDDHQTTLSFRQGISDRGDGWMEIRLGDFYVDEGSQGIVEARFLNTNDFSMEGHLIVEGIEFRPTMMRISAFFRKPTEVGKSKNKKGKGIFANFRIPST
ncbi:F-box protein PP2-B1 [Sesamum alatum]|uniref:F-box protein PP2-B1 n=1 Tax=Sesamum alatum TaxID=300844 RepID=A0AAE1Y7T3_9LAMI|nr:F-box protein PP2-B1 [Sesamum alatum]